MREFVAIFYSQTLVGFFIYFILKKGIFTNPNQKKIYQNEEI